MPVVEAGSPRAPEYVFAAGVPILGVCYGMQTMAAQLGGAVQGSNLREFGYARVEQIATCPLFKNIEDGISENNLPLLDVRMSHGDKVSDLSPKNRTMTSMRFPLKWVKWRSQNEKTLQRRTNISND